MKRQSQWSRSRPRLTCHWWSWQPYAFMVTLCGQWQPILKIVAALLTLWQPSGNCGSPPSANLTLVTPALGPCPPNWGFIKGKPLLMKSQSGIFGKFTLAKSEGRPV